jgi:hypothetical protein
MQIFAALALTALLACNAAIIVATSAQLPPRVASQFNGQGLATGFMQLGNYVLLMGGVAIGLPLLLVILLVALPRVLPTRLRIPSREYWTAPARREDTLRTVTTSGLVIACVLALFTIAVHLLVVGANSRTPPQLDNIMLYTCIAILILALLAWQFMLWRRFQVPR